MSAELTPTLAAFIDQFIDSTGIEPPSRHGDGTVEMVCSHTAPGGFVPLLTVTIISPDGRSRSARIEVEAARVADDVS